MGLRKPWRIKMGRRTRQRWVKKTPNNFYFSYDPPFPDNIVILTVSEFEAMRLKHYINLNQKDASLKMNVSQPTFSRILENAHQKATQALIEGKKIVIFGGNFNVKESFKGYGCFECDAEWEDKEASREKKGTCPKCNSGNVYFLIKEPL